MGSGISGGDLRFFEIVRRIKDKINVHILTTAGGAATCKNENLSIPLIVVRAYLFRKKENNVLDRITSYIITIIYSIKKIKDLEKYDVVYSTSDFLCDVIPAWYYKKNNPEAVWIAMIHHRYDYPWKRKGKVVSNFLGYISQQLSFKLFIMYSDSIFVYKTDEGEDIKKIFSQKGYSKKRIFKVENGIDYNFISDIVSPPTKYTACFIAALRESKGIFDLIEIWKLVCDKEKNAKLIVVGSGEKDLLKKIDVKIRNYCLEDNIVLAGRVSHGKKLFEIIKSSKLLLSTSYEEGWGIAICEGMACGLPVVAYDLEVYKKIYPEGIVRIPLHDVKKFSLNILNVLGDHALYNRLSNDAIEVAKRYNWDKIAQAELKMISLMLK